KAKWYARLSELEAKKTELTPRLVPLTDTANGLLAQLGSLRESLEAADKGKTTRLLDMFLERVVPVFEVREIRGKRRTVLTGVRFEPRKNAVGKHVMPDA